MSDLVHLYVLLKTSTRVLLGRQRTTASRASLNLNPRRTASKLNHVSSDKSRCGGKPPSARQTSFLMSTDLWEGLLQSLGSSSSFGYIRSPTQPSNTDCESGTYTPETMSTSGVKLLRRFSSQLGSARHPPSIDATNSCEQAEMPMFRPFGMLVPGAWISFKFGCDFWNCLNRSTVPSVEPPSTKMISSGGFVCASRDEMSASIVCASFRMLT